MRESYRILDANLNRAREALRVIEDCGRFALNDPAVTAMAKNMRSDLREVHESMPVDEMLASRDTPGDIGTEITSPTEPTRKDLPDVARAACKRLTEALRSIEEYAKFLAPAQTLKIERMRYNGYTLEQRLIQRLLVAERFAGVRVYVLVSSDCCRSMRDMARGAITGGADAIQVREKNTPDDQFLALAAELRELTDETSKLLIVNDRPDIAGIVGADGVHLGQHDLPIAEARRLLRPGAIVGRSTHSAEQARAAVTEGADYVAVGPMFPSKTKPEREAKGVELMRRVAEVVERPLVGVGGITAENAAEVRDAGAQGVALSHAVCTAEDPKAVVRAVREAVCGS